MPNSSHTKRFDFSLLLNAFTFAFCLSVAFWYTNIGGFNYVFAAGWVVMGCVYLSLGISDYVDEKIKTALRDKTAEAPTITTERR